ncbi:MAG: efflux RND transporter periplasmic adaptor subunit [Deltaproteobacteria bacterium]|jgi:HlyD family secretion protein|nr:efflux RND transporter periplasmic adaptor subunit [Deltaproteobacteria bacterium]
MKSTSSGAAVAALAITLLGGCTGRASDAALRASGHVEATEVRISSKVAGRLQALRVDEGATVAAGAEVAKVDPVDLELALGVARADRDSADAQLRLLLAGTRAEEIAEAEASLVQAQADLLAASKDLERAKALVERGSATVKARDDALARRDVAAGRADAARERLRKARAGARAEEIDAARARLAGAEARIAQLAQQLADTSVTSPLAGIVTEKIAEAGEHVAPGGTIVVVTDVRDAWLSVYVPEPDLDWIKIGQDAAVVTDGGTERRGRVTFVASQAEFTPKNVQTKDERVKLVFKVKISLENADGLFKPGMPAEAVLTRGGTPTHAAPAR